jgi:osmotically-inducible protein OsmY
MYFSRIDDAIAHDDKLVCRVAAALQPRLGTDVRDLRIISQINGLVLYGRVSTFYGKQIAQEVAREVTGMEIAANQIEVY